MSTVFLYSDEGVCPDSLRATVRSLKAVANRPVQFVNRQTFISPGWEEQAALIVFPGGRDVPYANALQGAANQRIRHYVEKGGRYLGICAGGYYGCDSICFEKGGPLEVIGQRELKFFPGQAIGPALGLRQFSYEGLNGARITRMRLSNQHFSIAHAETYYNGGSLFLRLIHIPMCKFSPALKSWRNRARRSYYVTSAKEKRFFQAFILNIVQKICRWRRLC